MRVAVVNWTSRQVGGAETYLSRFLRGMQDDEIYFWSEIDTPAGRAVIDRVADLPSSCVAADGLNAAFRQLSDWRPDVLYVHGLQDPRIEERLLALSPAVLFGHNYYGTCISGTKTVSFPVIRPCNRRFTAACLARYHVRGCGGLNPWTMTALFRTQAHRMRLLPKYTGVVTFSEHMRLEFSRHGVSPERIHVLPSLGETAGAPLPPRAEGPDQTDEWRIAFVGRLDRLKGCRVLLESLAAVRPHVPGRIIVTIAGDGPDLAACRAAAAALPREGTEVKFTGWITPDVRDRLLAESHLLVMPGLWPEPHGLVGLEALRLGTPVTAFDSGGIREWLEDGRNGTLAPADPPTAAGLAAAIVRCLTTPGILTGTRERARTGEPVTDADHLDRLRPLLERAAAGAAGS